MASLNSDTVPIGKLFAEGQFFAIPNYQRPFSWDRDQLSDLVDDLIDANHANDYFLGTLVLHQLPDGAFDIVDGQQRLTALSILLACLRDLLEVNSEQVQEMLVQPEKIFQGIPSRVRVTVRDSAPYEKIVCNASGTSNLVEPDNLITNAETRYREAVTIFRGVLKERSQAELRGLVEFIVQHVVVIYLAANSFEDAFRLFTVVNDRGKQLRRIDVLKAINLSPGIISDSGIREEYARKWETFEESLGESDFESLFHALRLVYVQDKPEGDLVHEFETRVYGKTGRPSAGTAFINELGDYVDLYDALFISRDYMAGTPDHAKFKTLMYSMVSEFRASEWRACVLAYAKKFKTDGLMNFVLGIEKLFVSQWVRGVRKDERYSSYTGALKSIEALRNVTTVTQTLEVDMEPIREACRGTSFYGAGYAKYLLVRAEIQAAELSDPREFAPRSIEHVLPQNPKADSDWTVAFTVEEMNSLVHTAGNLVLLSKGKNSSAQNKEFANKKQTYLMPKVSDYPRSLETIAVDKWDPGVVKARTETFALDVLGAL